MNELVSIIIPIYKTESYLKDCLNSIITQTYKNLEILLIDDGSPDNCPKICDEYAKKDSRIKVIHKENGGLSSARNTGLDACTGKYISFIDSDDIISKEFISELYGLLIKYNCDISQCDYFRFNNDDIINDHNNSDDEYHYDCISAQKMLLSRGNSKYMIVCNKLYKKTIYDNIRFPIGKLHEDEYCTYKAFDNAKMGVAITNKKLYYYRNTNASITNSFNIRRYDALQAGEEMIEYYKNNNELYCLALLKYSDLLKGYYKKTYYYLKDNKKEYLKLIKGKLKENYSKIKKCSLVPTKKKMIKFLISRFPFIYTIISDKSREHK